ncbi:Vacuolar protein sorting-associated protein 20 [Entomortierella beljakovae]|nr:Vacuolar protein sorting-associated protein 20 [Entomortierella beljakovae]
MGSTNSKTNKITAHDKAILDLKVQRDKLKQYNKRLSIIVEKELGLAKSHLAKGDKKRALLALRRKKFQEGLLEKTELQMTNLDELTFSIEQALVEQQVFAGLAAGNQVLKELHKEMSLSDVEKLMDDTAESIAYQNEIDELLCTRLSVAEEEDIERELDAMLDNELPSVPIGSLGAELQEQEDELQEQAQSDADQLVDTMAAQTGSIIDGLRPCRRRERVRKRRAQRQRHIRAHLQEDIDGNSAAGVRVECEDDIITNEFWRRHQRQRIERSEIQDPSSMPSHSLHINGHAGECMGEGDGAADRLRGKQRDEVAGEKLWEFVVGWCLIGCIFTGLTLILGATLKAQDGVPPEASWTIDVDDKDSLIDIVVAHILKIALGIKDFGDQLMEQGIFIFIVGVNGYVLVRQRVFARRRLYEAELMQGDALPKELSDREDVTAGDRRVGCSMGINEVTDTNIEKNNGAGDFYANIEMMQSSGFMTMEEPIITHPISGANSQSRSGQTREIQSGTKEQGEENDNSPEFGTMSILAWFNYLQVGILVIEFLQLFSFPLRELMEFYNQTEKTSALYENAKSVLSILGAAASVGRNYSLDNSLGNNSFFNSDIFISSLRNASNLSHDTPVTLTNNSNSHAKKMDQNIDFAWLQNNTAITTSWFRNITASTEWMKENFPGLTNITEVFANSSLPLNKQSDLEEMRDQIINAATEIAAQGWSVLGANNTATNDTSSGNTPNPSTKKMAGDSDIVMQVVNSLGLQPSINTHDWFTQNQEQSRRENNSPQASSVFDSIVVSLIDPASTVSPMASTLLCTGPQVQPSLYLAASLMGYTLAYLLFMVFLTSFERLPNKGEICFRPNGVAVLKNLGLLLAVDFLLIQSPSQRRFRGLVSMAIMLAMACYTIRMKPCYWDKINYWRTFSFSCVLYASLLVALLCPAPDPDKVKGDRIGGKWVMAPHLKMGHSWSIGGGPKVMLAWIATGWAILIVVFVLVDRVFLRHWIQKQKSQSDINGFRHEGGPRNGHVIRQDRHSKPDEDITTSSLRCMTRDGVRTITDPQRYQTPDNNELETPPRGVTGSVASGSHWSIVDLACEDSIRVNYPQVSQY